MREALDIIWMEEKIPDDNIDDLCVDKESNGLITVKMGGQAVTEMHINIDKERFFASLVCRNWYSFHVTFYPPTRGELYWAVTREVKYYTSFFAFRSCLASLDLHRRRRFDTKRWKQCSS